VVAERPGRRYHAERGNEDSLSPPAWGSPFPSTPLAARPPLDEQKTGPGSLRGPLIIIYAPIVALRAIHANLVVAKVADCEGTAIAAAGGSIRLVK
jgi:hypothetical protein